MLIKNIICEASGESQVIDTVTAAVNNHTFLNVVSLNPEILVEAAHNKQFETAISSSRCKFLDGVGCEWAYKRLCKKNLQRVGGVDLMCKIVASFASGDHKVRALYVGGAHTTAQIVAQKLQNPRVESMYINDAVLGSELARQVRDMRPDIAFFAFGSPAQEIFIHEHSHEFEGIVCMGVGGAFDFVAGNVLRAPKFVQKLGLEFLFRLVVQPWRIKRQMKLLKFVRLVLGEE